MRELLSRPLSADGCGATPAIEPAMLSGSADLAETLPAVRWSASAGAESIAPAASPLDAAKPLTTLDTRLGIFTAASSRERLETRSPIVP